MSKMPLIFIGHGSPMNAIESNKYTKSWQKIGTSIEKPRAILMLSAHWITEGETRISTVESPQMIYDMGGFPPELYRVSYDAPGSREIAEEIFQILSSQQSSSFSVTNDERSLSEKSEHRLLRASQGQEQSIQVKKDPNRGFDHGVWSTLIHLFPDADIPVITMSLDYSSHPSDLVRLGESLAILRERGVLIIGSGNIVHNLGTIDWSSTQKYSWAVEFDTRVANGLIAGKNSSEGQDLLDFRSWGDISRLAHPSYDHLLPLFPLFGASDEDDRVEFHTPEIEMGSLSMRSVVWR